MKNSLQHSITIISYAFLFLILSSGKANASSILGVVKDSLNNAVDVATVSLFRTSESTFIKAELTDVDGKFEFVDIPEGNYYLTITLLGYQDFESDDFVLTQDKNEITIPDIHLNASGVQLDEVSVVAQRPFIERRSDRLIVNVENSILASGGSAMDVLERSPGVIVSAGESISIRGRSGVIFMIDGKPSPMSAQDMANYLKAMPSSSIERVEIITNPSAKYDAAGNAGIIDIRLKKDKNQGTNGSFTTSYSQGVYPKAAAGINFNHRDKKVNVFGSYNHSYRMGLNDLRLYRVFFEDGERTGAYNQRNYLKLPFHFNMGRLGIDYNVSPNTVIGVLASGNLNKFKPGGQNTSDVENGNQEVISSFATTNQSEDVWPSYSFNGNFKHTFPSHNQELTVDLDYAKYWNNTDQHFTTRYYDLEGIESSLPYLLFGDLQGNLNIKSVKADYAHPFTKDVKLEAGVKASVVGADNDLQFFDQSEIGQSVFDSTISNHFIYEEKINAAYLNFSRNWSKFSLQSGLRVENTIAVGHQLINGQSFDRNYTNLFPSIFLNYNFSDHYSMGLNMSRRLDRPSYEQLNPFKHYLDPSTYREGNPYLNPQFTWSFEWNHTFFQRFTATLSYALTTDNITQVIAPVEGLERVTVQTDKNLDEVEYYSFNASAPISIGKWWNNTINFDAYIGKYKGNYAFTDLNDGNLVFNFVTNNTFQLGHDWSAELNFNYHSREVYAFMDLNPMWGLGAGIQKMLMKKKATLKLAVTDIFWTNLPSAFIKYRDYQETFEVFRETRQASISYTYRFGDKQLTPSRRRLGGAEDEKQRAGTGAQG
jgi:hypothetical protein